MATQRKHTPGPWTLRPVPSDSQDGKISFWIDTADAAPLADVRTRPDNEHEANARLMTAAPKLDESLVNLMRHATYMANMEKMGQPMMPIDWSTLMDLATDARDAHFRATGE